MSNRQLDITGTRSDFYVLPRNLPGRLDDLSFVNFDWDECLGINPDDYTVVIESNDAAGPKFRSISKLKRKVELPLIQYGWQTKLGVIPNKCNLPSFTGYMYRGSTYKLPNVSHNGVYQLKQLGLQRHSGI